MDTVRISFIFFATHNDGSGKREDNLGCKIMMDATATNDNWKLTSNSHKGLNNNMPKAVSANTCREAGFSSRKEAMAWMLNIMAERMTEVDSPVKMAKAQRMEMTKQRENGLNHETRLHKGMKNNSKKP